MIAVTNGLDLRGHYRIQESISNRYPVSVSMTIGTDSSPAKALSTASQKLQNVGSAQDSDRIGVLRGETIDQDVRNDTDLEIAHFDIINMTVNRTDKNDEYSSMLTVQECYLSLALYLYQNTGSLTFFVGGDNFISLCPFLSRNKYQDAIDHVYNRVGVRLRVGVGTGKTADIAGMDAKEALEHCRETQKQICQHSSKRNLNATS